MVIKFGWFLMLFGNFVVAFFLSGVARSVAEQNGTVFSKFADVL